MGAVALRRRAACRPNRGVRCLGEWRARARHGASPSRHLRRGLLRIAGRRVPTACRDAELASARVPRRRHAGAVLPRERDPVGGRAARCRCGCCHDRAGRVARRRVLERRVPADGGVGVWVMARRPSRRSRSTERQKAGPEAIDAAFVADVSRRRSRRRLNRRRLIIQLGEIPGRVGRETRGVLVAPAHSGRSN